MTGPRFSLWALHRLRAGRWIVLAALCFLALPARCAPPDLSEAAGWLQRYLRVDSSNPAGEKRAAAFLAGILQQEGIPFRIVVSPAGRPNVYARLVSAASGGRAILLLHHMDVVPPGPGWTVNPFAGRVDEGELWGRGALDDKSHGVAHLAALVDLKRRRVPLARDVVFLAVADEENGGLQGTGWLISAHPELFQGVEGVINEGGRNQVTAAGKLFWWGVEVAQKRPLWLEISTSGRGGHGAGLNPASATHQLVLGLARLLEAAARWRVTPAARTYCARLAPLQNPHWRRVFANIDAVIAENGPKEFLIPGMANLFLDTVQVTVVRGGDRINVIPPRASARLDVRLLPDTDAEAFLAEVKGRLGRGFEVRVLVTAPPSRPSPFSGPVYLAIEGALAPEGPLVPAFIAGFTDSRFFRQRGIPAYGVLPFTLPADKSEGIHGADERIPLAELDRGVVRMKRLVALYATAAAR